MRLTIDTNDRALVHEDHGVATTIPLYSRRGFEILSDLWLKVGWNEKHLYTFTWLGRPIIQLPEDLIRVQEAIYRVRPDVIIETGVAHGGSLVFYASLCKAMGKGRVVGIDVEIRPHNRQAIEAHELTGCIDLVEGDAKDPAVVRRVHDLVGPGQTAFVLLDSDHSKKHVLAELEAYHDLVSPGSYIVACDGIMDLVHDTPRGKPGWEGDNPTEAAREFAARHPEFTLEQPAWSFNESGLEKNVTHWPSAWLRRR